MCEVTTLYFIAKISVVSATEIIASVPVRGNTCKKVGKAETVLWWQTELKRSLQAVPQLADSKSVSEFRDGVPNLQEQNEEIARDKVQRTRWSRTQKEHLFWRKKALHIWRQRSSHSLAVTITRTTTSEHRSDSQRQRSAVSALIVYPEVSRYKKVFQVIHSNCCNMSNGISSCWMSEEHHPGLHCICQAEDRWPLRAWSCYPWSRWLGKRVGSHLQNKKLALPSSRG